MPTLTLIRGLPGSGKSTLARHLKSTVGGRPLCHLETDRYFVGVDGSYKFDPTQLLAAHEWCQKHTEQRMQGGCDIVVSNTFTKLWEMQPYIDMAKEYDYDLQVIHVQGPWKSEHDVPVETINKMKDRWEDYDV